MIVPHKHDFNMRGICVLCGYEIDKRNLKDEVKLLREKMKVHPKVRDRVYGKSKAAGNS